MKKDWFDEHVIIDFGDFNNKDDKKKADELKDKLKHFNKPVLDFDNAKKENGHTTFFKKHFL